MKKISSLIFIFFAAGCFQTVLCQTATPTLFAPGIVSTEFQETTASFTPDMKTVYFTRSDIQFSDNTIMESHFKNGKWTEPQVSLLFPACGAIQSRTSVLTSSVYSMFQTVRCRATNR